MLTRSLTAAAAALVFAAAPASALTINVTDFDLVFGPGYTGSGAPDNGSSVDLTFSNDSSEIPTTFTLPDGSDFDFSFQVGEFIYDEDSTSGEASIPPEALTIGTTFTLANGQILSLTGQGDAFATDPESDQVEFLLNFDPEEFTIDGEQVRVTLSDLVVLASTGEPLTESLSATFTLQEAAEVPAPGALALLGLGLIGLAGRKLRR